jgi:hypothetical protein
LSELEVELPGWGVEDAAVDVSHIVLVLEMTGTQKIDVVKLPVTSSNVEAETP